MKTCGRELVLSAIGAPHTIQFAKDSRRHRALSRFPATQAKFATTAEQGESVRTYVVAAEDTDHFAVAVQLAENPLLHVLGTDQPTGNQAGGTG